MGFFASFLFLWIVDGGKRENELPSKGVLLAVFLAIGALIADGFSSYIGLRETTNNIRLITGLMSGLALPLLLFPLFNYQVWKRSSYKPIVRERWQKMALVLIFILAFAVIQIIQKVNLPLGAEILSSLVVFCVLFTFVIINLVLISLLPIWYRRADSPRQLVVPLFVALALTLLELSLSFFAHKYLISLVL